MLLNRNRKPHVNRRRRITSATTSTMKTLPTMGITQLKNHTPAGLSVDGGTSSAPAITNLMPPPASPADIVKQALLLLTGMSTANCTRRYSAVIRGTAKGGRVRSRRDSQVDYRAIEE